LDEVDGVSTPPHRSYGQKKVFRLGPEAKLEQIVPDFKQEAPSVQQEPFSSVDW